MPPHSPPLLYAATTGATPFRFHLHVDDLGHTLMVGPPGAGKSTALALMAAQWFRFPNARVEAFDKGFSLYALTHAAGGEFYDVGGDGGDIQFCPLEQLETNSDMAWAAEWLETLCVLQGFQVTPRERNLLAEALALLRTAPSRTLTDLCANVQDMDMREALRPYLIGQPLGNLLDADVDIEARGRFVTYEIGALMGMGEKAVSAVLPYIFRKIIRRMENGNGEPTLILVDEAWVALAHELFKEQLRMWLKTLRKLNGVVVLATQNLSDVFNSSIRDVVLENCPTKILLPNAAAGDSASRQAYLAIGLGEVEIDAIRDALPKRDYYVASAAGRRMIDFGFGDVALAFCGVNGLEDRRDIERLMKRWGKDWPEYWLASRGLREWPGSELLRKDYAKA